MLKGNVIKGWITSIVGVVTMITTLLLVFTGQMDFVWNGIAGLSIGTVLLMAPQTIETQFAKLFGMMKGKGQADDITPPDAPSDETNTRKD